MPNIYGHIVFWHDVRIPHTFHKTYTMLQTWSIRLPSNWSQFPLIVCNSTFHMFRHQVASSLWYQNSFELHSRHQSHQTVAAEFKSQFRGFQFSIFFTDFCFSALSKIHGNFKFSRGIFRTENQKQKNWKPCVGRNSTQHTAPTAQHTLQKYGGNFHMLNRSLI